ncbi:Oidioi.mRNA.OKI2018_I69.chr1.g2833.t1.cds [Oikopleura dioica]|uniref:Oidioi.mRNA.OKI2018_I69.chr1.g2833.t1.cds n=1 Tax=Oikopleura dioica TaxID=34765 RepID=A0ABN7SW73_OIKDI|nr:Oidioi.mRNA.OKI2018_I69.chr1.g2833.t1.cds [Oikopleura dioica]
MAHKSKYYKELNDGVLDLSMQNLKTFPLADLLPLADRIKRLDLSRNNLIDLPPEIATFKNLTELDLSGNALSILPNEISKCSKISKLILEGNALTNLPEDFVELKRLFHLDLRGNPLSPHLQNAAGDCQSKRECEVAAGRVMKFQAVYQQKCQKTRKEAEAKKRKEQNRAKRAAKEAKLAEKEKRRKAWEQEQLRKKLESDIFGSNEGELKDGEENTEEEEEASIEMDIEENKSSTYSMKMFIFAILAAILAVYFELVQIKY